jgi:exopolyphosphatase/guanosine-5'-triphosphate,3'-diphosphate pyrophosphatase
VCELPPEGIVRPKKLASRQVITRLSGGFSSSFGLAKEAMERSIDALKQFRVAMDELGVAHYKAVGTGVLRRAVNRQDFLERAKQEADIALEIIDPKKEALLTYEGVISTTSSPIGYPVLIIDVGGFSVEFIYAETPLRPTFMASLDIGSVLLRERFLISDPPTPQEIQGLRDYLLENLNRLQAILYSSGCLGGLKKKGQLIGTAGTLTTLAQIDMALADYNPLLIQNYILTEQRLETVFEQLIRLPSKDRLAIRGLKPGREDVIVAGALLVIEAVKAFRKPGIVVSDAGLLEGLMEEVLLELRVSTSDSS